ncbi:MAG TPA: CoA transferase [Acidimicrobiales bacterium]|nr:CoA transferase [Acidimicrobiales bacterium]
MSVGASITGPALPVAVARRRLAGLGALDDPEGHGLHCGISWYGPSGLGPDRVGSEATVQARSGLMHLHGRDAGAPRRLGLELASVAAGVLSACGVLAGLVARRRGGDASGLETSVLQAGLLAVSHYVAAATCAEEWVPAPPGPEPGPPFCSSDGHWFEIETLDPEAWKGFWYRLGATGADLSRAWAGFRARYYRSTCTFPPGLHEATARFSLGELVHIAGEWGVSLAPLRGYEEVLAQPTGGPHPAIERPGNGGLGEVGAAPAAGRSAPRSGLPLEGIRVVEATTRMQGPLAGLLLEMLGASVVKVEPPGGDFGRIVPPLAGDVGSFFACFNRGKRSVEIDLSGPAGRAELVELTDQSDVFLHNWRPGKAAEWGLDAPDLARGNPSLVYATASGWGEGPRAPALLGTDFLVQAHAGVGNGLRPEGEPPFPSRVIVVDFMGALVTAEGVLGGLYVRERTGRGPRVSTSLHAGAMTLQDHVLTPLAAGGDAPGRHRGRPRWGPLDQPVPTTDGLLVVGLDGDGDALPTLCRMCQVDAGADDRQQRVADRLADRPAAEWVDELSPAGIAGAVLPESLDLAALPDDTAMAPLFERLAGSSRVPRSPWRFG